MPKAAPGTAPAGAGPRCAGDPAGSRPPTVRWRSHPPARFIGHNSVLWPGKTPGPFTAPARKHRTSRSSGAGVVCPALRQPARHGSRRAERSAAFGDLRGVDYASPVRIKGWLCNGILAAHALQVSRPMLALLELLVGLIDVAGLLIDAADFVVRLFRKRDS